ncbi:MAG: fatty acid desaturase [Bacteroidales bacterium]|nr:fatty acid desaturase [Bacteroidales bacterium]
MDSLNNQSETSNTTWIKIVSKYNSPNAVKSWWQLTGNLLLYSFAWFLMFESLTVSWWVTLGLSFPAAGMLVRLFIIYHDCGHGSFFRSEKLNNAVGLFIGVLTFTPYFSWSHEHYIHHETAGNLDKRDIGDVWTLTVDEYRESSKWKKIMYRFYRHPITMFGIGAFLVFVIVNRFSRKTMDRRAKLGVYATNTGLLMFAAGMSLLIGVKAFLLIQLPIITVAGIIGFWLFYVQHQFNPIYWARTETWDYKRMALEGSSYYKLPRILQYFSGNIGFHHIHHLSPMIPNYNLSQCHRENAMFNEIRPLTFWKSLKTLTFRLWDEKGQEMVSFRKMSRVGVMTRDK